MRPRSILLLGMMSACKQEPPPAVMVAKTEVKVPVMQPNAVIRHSSIEEALALATPTGVSITFDGAIIVGTGKTYDDVSEFMRALNNIASCPQGFCRVVERSRSGNFRVELLDGGVLEYLPGEVHFPLSKLALKWTEVVDGSVHFEIHPTFPPH